jgi:hypothetical protein
MYGQQQYYQQQQQYYPQQTYAQMPQAQQVKMDGSAVQPAVAATVATASAPTTQDALRYPVPVNPTQYGSAVVPVYVPPTYVKPCDKPYTSYATGSDASAATQGATAATGASVNVQDASAATSASQIVADPAVAPVEASQIVADPIVAVQESIPVAMA